MKGRKFLRPCRSCHLNLMFMKGKFFFQKEANEWKEWLAKNENVCFSVFQLRIATSWFSLVFFMMELDFINARWRTVVIKFADSFVHLLNEAKLSGKFRKARYNNDSSLEKSNYKLKTYTKSSHWLLTKWISFILIKWLY